MERQAVSFILVRVLRRTAWMAGLLLVCSLAYANPGGGRFAQRDAHRPNGPQHAPAFQREAPQTFPRHDQGDVGDAQRQQRLSPDERRQLRRDIRDAGRDIYRPGR